MRINNNSVRGIFKYSSDITFEKDDFVVDGNCIYICTDPHGATNVRPSEDVEHKKYSEYPGNKIISASEYYDYVQSEDRNLQVEDKYVSAHSLCEILENMYFGFGDNGILYDHIIYNPNTGIEYSIRGVHEILDYSTPNILDMVLRSSDLNNGLLKISRNLPEISDLLLYDTQSESDVIILKQYTYLDSDGMVPYRVQELMDPEKNRLYFRFAKGINLESGGHDFSDSVISRWRSLFGSDSDILEMLNTVEEYWTSRVETEYREKIARIRGRYCYREVEASETNYLGSNSVFLYPGEIRDIKSVEDFTSRPCLLDILVKVSIGSESGVYRNYSITLDAKDVADSSTNQEVYNLDDNIYLTAIYDGSGEIQCLNISVNSGVIKDIYYRDKTLDHIHEWVRVATQYDATCTEPGLAVFECRADGCPLPEGYQRSMELAPLGHILDHQSQVDPTCTQPGNWEYWYCKRPGCEKYFMDEGTTQEYSGWDTGSNPVYRPASGSHTWGDWYIRVQPKCTTPGVRVKTCTACGEEIREYIDPLGHNIIFVPTVPATCGKFGILEHYHCSQCGKDFSDQGGQHEISQEDLKIYPSGHNFHNISSVDVIITESTYTDFPDINAPKPQHGTGYKICENCNNKIEVSIPFKQHIFPPDQDNIGPAVYSNGYHYPEYHQGVENGEIRRNYNFNNSVPIERQLENHTIRNKGLYNYTQATCTEYGYWTGECVLCGATNVRQFDWNSPPTGHEIPESLRDAWIPNTCTEDAKWRGSCEECGETGVYEVDTDHLVIGHSDSNGDHICDNEGCNINNL